MRTKVTSDAGLLAYRGLDKALSLFDRVPSVVQDLRTGRNIQHDLPALLRQSVYSRRVMKMSTMRRLSVDPTMRRVTGKKNAQRQHDGWKEHWRKPLIDASFWIWTVRVLSMANLSFYATIPCFVSKFVRRCLATPR